MSHALNGDADEDQVDDLCKKAFVLAIKDALNVVSGKWKLAIVCTLLSGSKGFAEMERLLDAITPRMLSRELRELEVNGVIARENEVVSAPRFRKYALTPSGRKLEAVIFAFATWGQEHRAVSTGDLTAPSNSHSEKNAV